MTELIPWKSRTRPNSSTKWPESTWIEVRGGEVEVEVVEEIEAKTMEDKRRANISQLQPELCPCQGSLRIHNCLWRSIWRVKDQPCHWELTKCHCWMWNPGSIWFVELVFVFQKEPSKHTRTVRRNKNYTCSLWHPKTAVFVTWFKGRYLIKTKVCVCLKRWQTTRDQRALEQIIPGPYKRATKAINNHS